MFSFAGLKKYFYNTSWLLVDQVFKMIAGFLIGVFIARYLGPGRYGTLNYAISYVGLLSFLYTLGLDEILVREIVNHPDQKNDLVGSAFYLKLIGSLALIAIIPITFHLFHDGQTTRIIILIFAVASVFQSFQVLNNYLQSQVQAKYVAISSVIATVLISLSKIALLIVQAPLIAFAITYAMEFVIFGVALYFISNKVGFSLRKCSFKMDATNTLMINAWPMLLSSVAVLIYMRIDQIMVKQMISAEANGLYAVAVFLASSWYFIPMSIANSLFPAILSSKQQSEETYEERLQLLFDAVIWLAILVSIATVFIGPLFITIVFGKAYSGAGSVLIIYIWSGVFVSFGLIFSKRLVADNLQKYLTAFIVAGAVINIILNYLLIPHLRLTGCALATLIAQATTTYLCAYAFPKTRINSYMFNKSLFPFHLIKQVRKYLLKTPQN